MPVYQNETTGLWYWKEEINGVIKKRTNKNWSRKKYAKEDLDKFLEDVANNQESPYDASFELVAKKYVEFLDIKFKKSTKQRAEQTIKKYLIPYFGKKKMKNIKLYDIEKFQLFMLNLIKPDGTPMKNSYIEKMQITTRKIFEYAVAHEYINRNPFIKTTIAKHNHLEPKKEITILTYDEFKQFMSVVTDKIDRAAFSILYWCGLRSGELLGLNVEDYDRENKILHVNKTYDPKNRILTVTKNRINRDVNVPDECATEIEILIDSINELQMHKKSPLIGVVERYSKTTFERRKKEYTEESKIRYFTFHDLRHTHVSTLINIGWEAKDIADRLGHSVEMVNNTYGHLFPSRIESNMKKLNALSK